MRCKNPGVILSVVSNVILGATLWGVVNCKVENTRDDYLDKVRKLRPEQQFTEIGEMRHALNKIMPPNMEDVSYVDSEAEQVIPAAPGEPEVEKLRQLKRYKVLKTWRQLYLAELKLLAPVLAEIEVKVLQHEYYDQSSQGTRINGELPTERINAVIKQHYSRIPDFDKDVKRFRAYSEDRVESGDKDAVLTSLETAENHVREFISNDTSGFKEIATILGIE